MIVAGGLTALSSMTNCTRFDGVDWRGSGFLARFLRSLVYSLATQQTASGQCNTHRCLA